MDTVAAIATPPGTGAIGIIRVTGPRSRAVLRAVVPGLPDDLPPRLATAGWARDPATGDRIDSVLAIAFDAGSSYTGEEAAEIHAHAGPGVLAAILAATTAAGAVPAPPGEFTRRAFLNGRMDLLQAEAVAQMVAARSARAARASAFQLAGGLSRRIEEARDPLVRSLASVEAAIDFPDGEVPPPDAAAILAAAVAAAGLLEGLVRSWPVARRIMGGVRAVLAGPPNAGKSSILNRIAGRDRSIVDEEPGTTRDYLEVGVEISGLWVTLVDTAGLRAGGDRIERKGIDLALEAASGADVVVIVVDARGIEPGPLEWLTRAAGEARILIARNKIDLGDRPDPEGAIGISDRPAFPVSALTGQGIDALAAAIAEADGAAPGAGEAILACERHRSLVEAAAADARRAASAVQGGQPEEIVAAEIRSAVRRLDELTGREIVPDVLDAIFAGFCVGK